MPSRSNSMIRATVANPSNLGDVLAQVRDICGALSEEAATEASAGESVGAVDAAVAAGSGLGAFMVLGLLLGCILVCVLDRFVERALSSLLSRVPWVGGKLESAVHIIFKPSDLLEDAILGASHAVALQAWQGAQHFVRWEIDRIFPHTNTGKTVVTQPNLAPIYAQLGNDQADIKALQGAVAQLQHQVHGISGSPTVDTQPIYQSLHQLSHAIDVLYSNQTHLYQDIQTVQHNQTVIMHDLQQLQHQLTGVRTVQIGWADVVEQLQTLESGLSHQVASLQADMRTSQQRLTNLSPLTILLQPGLRGIRNLRKLEDNPCQCPQPQFLRPRNVEALAIELAIANGV